MDPKLLFSDPDEALTLTSYPDLVPDSDPDCL